MNLVQQRAKQRNITPNFLRFKRKNGTNSNNKRIEQPKVQTQNNTDRSSSRASKCSFEAYDRRILHMSKLKKHLQEKTKSNEENEVILTKRANYITGDIKNRTVTSNQKANQNTERDSSVNSQNQNFLIHRLNEGVRKRNSASGKILLKTNRTPSDPKRTQESLQKEQKRAIKVNNELFHNIMKNPTPNYLDKLKEKKLQANKIKKYAKKILNLNIPIKPQEEMKNYQIFGELGKGAYGTVRMGVDKRTGEKIAIKIYEKKRLDEPNKIKNLEREINILGELDHSVIAKLLDAIETQTEIYLILEYGGANSLYNYLLSKHEHRLKEVEAKKFFHVIADTLEYLHNLDIIHRDIKAENILINRHKDLKLIDFGFSLKCKKNGTIDTFCGTPTYMAPQIVSKIDHSPIQTDMWSLGILFFVMLQGNYPFRARNENELFEKIKKGQFTYIHEDISKESKRMIQNLLKVNPKDRLTIGEVLSKENKEWLSTHFE